MADRQVEKSQDSLMNYTNAALQNTNQNKTTTKNTIKHTDRT